MNTIILNIIIILITIVAIILFAYPRYMARRSETASTTSRGRLAELNTRLKDRAKILDQLQVGNKQRAIKLFQSQTGASLREAVDAINQLQAELPQQ